MHHTRLCVDVVENDYAVYVEFFGFALVGSFVDVPPHAHGIGLVFRLDAVREEPELALADEGVGDVGAGDVIHSLDYLISCIQSNPRFKII